MKATLSHLVLLSLAVLSITIDPIQAFKPRRGGVCNKGYTPQHNWMNADNSDVTKRGFLLLTLSWPGSFCEQRTCHTTTQIEPDFTIHGLWPNYASKGYPSCCETQPEQINGLDVQKQVYADPTLSQELADEWPDFSENNFIAYEFDKHGTCAMDVFDEPIQYIKTALDLKKEYKFFEALGLTQDEIESGAERTPDQLHHGFLTNGSKTNVILACNRNRELSEVRVCIKKSDDNTDGDNSGNSFEPFHCPQSLIRSESTCDEHNEVTIPPWIPLMGDSS